MKTAFSLFKKILFAPFRFFGKLSTKKKVVVIIILVITAVIIFSALAKANGKPKYTLVKAEKSDITETVSETGQISLTGTTAIYSPTNGVVETVFVENGQEVAAGDELFTIISTATEQEQSQALASYLTAKNTLDTAQASMLSLQATMFSKWDTFKMLAESSTYEEDDETPKYNARALPEFHIAEKEWLAAESNYKKQQSVIGQAQAAVSSTYLLYQATQDATVKATADGTIANVSVTGGNTVKANAVTTGSTPLATIVTPTPTEVVVSLSESDVAKVVPGQEAELDVSSVHDKIYHGVVRRVDTIGTSISGVVRYNAYLEINDPDDLLRPGMTVDAEIITNKLTDTLSVPNSVVKPYQGGRAVRVVDEQQNVEYVPVLIGVKGSERTQILEGISEGQEVITALSNEQIKRPGLFGG